MLSQTCTARYWESKWKWVRRCWRCRCKKDWGRRVGGDHKKGIYTRGAGRFLGGLVFLLLSLMLFTHTFTVLLWIYRSKLVTYQGNNRNQGFRRFSRSFNPWSPIPLSLYYHFSPMWRAIDFGMLKLGARRFAGVHTLHGDDNDQTRAFRHLESI